jgi:hypothetical protein
MSSNTKLIVSVAIACLAAGCTASPTSESGTSELGAATDGGMAVVAKVLTYQGFDAQTKTCESTQHMLVYEPVAAGRYPVMTYTVGTGGIYDVDEGRTVAMEMAKRGFVAASVEYDSLDLDVLFSCEPLFGNSSCVYGQQAESAVSTLCGEAKADCSRGVVTGGMSQGAALATLAQNYNPNVQAAWVMGFGGITIAGTTCAWVLPQDRLRIVDGTEQDQANLETITGCSSATHDCFRANGSGWYIVQDSELESDHSGHCYYIAPEKDGGVVGCTNFPPNGFDPGWAPPSTLTWSLDTDLNWLATFTN